MNDCRMPGPGDEATWGPVTGHPNDPRNTGTAHADLIASEADALLAEFTDRKSAEDFAFNWEALMEDRGTIIWLDAQVRAKFSPDVADTALGNFVHMCIRAAALRRAAHELEMAGA